MERIKLPLDPPTPPLLEHRQVICPATERPTKITIQKRPWGGEELSRCEVFGRGRVQCDRACLKPKRPG